MIKISVHTKVPKAHQNGLKRQMTNFKHQNKAASFRPKWLNGCFKASQTIIVPMIIVNLCFFIFFLFLSVLFIYTRNEGVLGIIGL